MGRLISVIEGWMSVFWGVGVCSCMVCEACVMSHVSILMSGFVRVSGIYLFLISLGLMWFHVENP